MRSGTEPDAVVIGAGPAGLMAAEMLADGGLSVLVAEAMPTAGRKLLMAGKSGLNLTSDARRRPSPPPTRGAATGSPRC